MSTCILSDPITGRRALSKGVNTSKTHSRSDHSDQIYHGPSTQLTPSTDLEDDKEAPTTGRIKYTMSHLG